MNRKWAQTSRLTVVLAVALAAGPVAWGQSPGAGETTDDAAAQRVTLFTRNPVTAVITDRSVFFTSTTALVAPWVYALRSDPGDDWEVSLSAVTPGSEHFCTIVAFNE